MHLGAVALAVVLFGPPLAAEAQQAARVHRIGILSESSPPTTESRLLIAFRQRGYVQGQNAVFEFRYAGERFERLPALAHELVRLKVDIIMTGSTPTAVAAKRATTVIPIITMSADPIGAGLVASLARPGNVTGVFIPISELAAKRLQLLREAVPDLDGVSKAITAKRARGLIVVQDPVTLRAASDLAQLAAKHRLPASYAYREFVDAGGLMSYGVSLDGLRQAVVEYADKVLRGKLPSDLPMEQPTRYEFVINLRTAKALGLTIPPSVLVRADQVIE